MGVRPDIVDLGPRPTGPIPFDLRHAFLTDHHWDHQGHQTDEEICRTWISHFERTGLPYRLFRDTQGRIKQIFIHRLVNGRWCCSEDASGGEDEE
jgi:hypothetical protein